MRNCIVLLCVLLCCIKCNVDIINESADSINDIKKYSLFRNTILEDSLVAFINSIDSIPNPWGVLPEYMIQFKRNYNCDTILVFSSSIEYMPINEFNIYLNHNHTEQFLLGGIQICEKNIMVRSEKINLDSVIYIQNLDKSLGHKLDSIREIVKDNPTGWEAPFYRSEKKYKFMYPDSLLLLESYYLGRKQ